MRYKEFIIEARSHPDQNVKKSGRVEAAEFLRQIPPTDLKNWGVSFTNINKVGINPHTAFNTSAINTATPAGVYFYPASYFIKRVQQKAEFPYADDAKYIQVFRFSPKKVFNLGRATKKDFEKASAIFGEPSEINGWGAAIILSIRQYLESNPGKNETWDLHRAYRKLGYDSILDFGSGLLQENEPYVGVILDTSIIGTVRMFRNIRPLNVDPRQAIKLPKNPPEKTTEAEVGKLLQQLWKYAEGRRWPSAEPYMAQYPHSAYIYARYWIKGPWPPAEAVFKANKNDVKSKVWAEAYAREVLNLSPEEAKTWVNS
jgi:hypothetical protein